MPGPPRIVVVRFSSIGDIILTTPLLRALRIRHPAATVTYITKREYLPLVEHSPRITEAIGLAPGGSLRALARAIRERRPTHQLDLHGSLRSRQLRWLAGGPWHGYPKHRLARGVLIRFKRDIYRDRRHVAERYFDAARSLDLTPDQDPAELFVTRASQEGARRFLGSQGLNQGRALVALAPGAAHFTKRWPTPHWRRLAALLAQAGYDIVVVGGPGDQETAATIAAAAGDRATSSAGRFDLTGTAALLKEARTVVAGDTGVMHMATAVGVPVVALYGPTVPAFGFTPYHARSTVLALELDCRPCSAMGGARCPLGHHRCLVDLEPERVEAAVRGAQRRGQ